MKKQEEVIRVFKKLGLSLFILSIAGVAGAEDLICINGGNCPPGSNLAVTQTTPIFVAIQFPDGTTQYTAGGAGGGGGSALGAVFNNGAITQISTKSTNIPAKMGTRTVGTSSETITHYSLPDQINEWTATQVDIATHTFKAPITGSSATFTETTTTGTNKAGNFESTIGTGSFKWLMVAGGTISFNGGQTWYRWPSTGTAGTLQIGPTINGVIQLVWGADSAGSAGGGGGGAFRYFENGADQSVNITTVNVSETNGLLGTVSGTQLTLTVNPNGELTVGTIYATNVVVNSGFAPVDSSTMDGWSFILKNGLPGTVTYYMGLSSMTVPGDIFSANVELSTTNVSLLSIPLYIAAVGNSTMTVTNSTDVLTNGGAIFDGQSSTSGLNYVICRVKLPKRIDTSFTPILREFFVAPSSGLPGNAYDDQRSTYVVSFATAANGNVNGLTYTNIAAQTFEMVGTAVTGGLMSTSDISLTGLGTAVGSNGGFLFVRILRDGLRDISRVSHAYPNGGSYIDFRVLP